MNPTAQGDYSKQGYIVVRNALPHPLVKRCLHHLESIKKRKFFIFYTQSTHRWERPRLSRNGFLIESILNPSQQIQAPRFAASVRDLIYHNAVYDALSSVCPACLDFVSWQDMAFDRSTGTVDHIDSWYLDTEQAGGVLGLWIALEDIFIESGPFFVCPKSHLLGEIPKSLAPSHDSFLSYVQKRIEDHGLKKVPMLLRQGDIIIWNSLLIHGALSPIDDSYSRKSLTAHFYPLGKRRNDALASNDLTADLHRLRPTIHPRIHRLSKPGRSPLFYAIGGPLLALKDRLGVVSSSAWNMRRS
jgi:phytanoyl-CoA hydroxylase